MNDSVCNANEIINNSVRAGEPSSEHLSAALHGVLLRVPGRHFLTCGTFRSLSDLVPLSGTISTYSSALDMLSNHGLGETKRRLVRGRRMGSDLPGFVAVAP